MAGRAVVRSLGAWLDGRPGVPRTVLELRVRWLLLVTVAVANGGGSLVVLLFAIFVVPDPPGIENLGFVRTVNVIAFFSYPIFAGPFTFFLGLRLLRPVQRLVREGGAPDEEQRRAVLLGPLRLTVMQGALWSLGAVGWAGLNIYFSGLLAVKTGLTCLLGAITTCTLVYLLAERLLRPAAALALAAGPPQRARLGGVTRRVILAWALGTAVPVLGLICVAIAALAVNGISTTQLAITILGLGGAALLVGLEVIYVATRAIADPIKSVRRGMAQVARGDLDTEVRVYDASEVGRLQAGFNHMVAGLREHERLRDLFGRHVGEDVAELAVSNDVELGGETREVAVLFVDIAGSTRLAETRPPGEVVGLLNMFFGVVVDEMTRHDGWINKFEGDAALAVFGAPAEVDDAPGQALAAARHLARRLRREVPVLDAGIGVSAGQVVAGYIGAVERLEYTVIGDPVNEAARLSDLAKVSPARVLASDAILAMADPDEADLWNAGRPVKLRGRSHLTRPAAPWPVPEEGYEDEDVSTARRRRLLRRPRLGLLRRTGSRPAAPTDEVPPPAPTDGIPPPVPTDESRAPETPGVRSAPAVGSDEASPRHDGRTATPAAQRRRGGHPGGTPASAQGRPKGPPRRSSPSLKCDP